MKKISKISFEKGFMYISIGTELFKVALSKASSRLSRSDESTLNNYKISPSGFGIHWPGIDEDLSIDGLLRIAKKI